MHRYPASIKRGHGEILAEVENVLQGEAGPYSHNAFASQQHPYKPISSTKSEKSNGNSLIGAFVLSFTCFAK